MQFMSAPGYDGMQDQIIEQESKEFEDDIARLGEE
jgi:hypothetical protein